MTLLAVQSYVQNLLDGLVAPGIPDACEAWVLPPPVVFTAPTPQIFVWGARGEEERFTLPRFHATDPGAVGQKVARHTLDVMVMYASEPGPDTEAFPSLIDAIRKGLRQADLETRIVDSVTGETSTTTNLGEKIGRQYGYPSALTGDAQQLIQNTCRLSVSASEIFVA